MAVRTISTKLVVDGEAEYKQAITACNAQLSLLKSGLAATASEFRNNANSLAALTAKDEKLNELKAAQAEKIQKLKDALENCRKAAEQYARQQETLQAKVQASDQAVASLDASSQKAGKRWAEYAQEVEKSERALEVLRRSSGDTSAEQAKLEESISKARAEMGRLEAATDGAAKEAGELIRENEKLHSALSDNEATLNAAARGANNWEKQLNSAQIEANKLDDELEKNSRYLEEAKTSADGCAASIDQYGKEVREAGDASQEFGDKSKSAVDQLAQAIVAAGLAEKVKDVAKALYDCVDTFAAFESQMSTVQAISGATAEEMARLTEKAQYMGSTTSFTATEAGKALEYMAMAGWKTGDMLDGLEGILYLAAASGEDLAATSDIVTDALTAFGLAASDSAHFADVLAKASSNSNTNVRMMGETFKYAAPVAGTLGYSIEDTALAVGLMANASIKASQAGTTLRSIFTRLATDAGASSTKLGALGVLTKQVGVEFYDMATQKARPLADVLMDCREAWKGFSDEQQTAYAKTIAGQEAMSGWLAIMNAADSDVEKLTAALQECSGAAYEMSQIQLDNYAGQLTLLDSAVDGLKLTIGSQLAPVLEELASGATTAVGGLAELLETCPAITAVLAGLTTAAGALTMAFAGFQILKTIKPLLIDFGAALAATPAGAAAVAIAGVAAALGTLAAHYKNAATGASGLNSELRQIDGKYRQSAIEITATATAAGELIDRLAGLEAQEAMTEGEAALYAQTVEQLKTLLPELNIELDEQTGLLAGGTDALAMNTEAWKENALARALQEKYQDVLEGQAQAMIDAAEKQLAYNDALAACTEIELQMQEVAAELQRINADSTLTYEEKAAKIAELTNQMDLLAAGQETAADSLNTQRGALEDAQAKVEEFDQELEHLTDTQNTLTGANEDGSESMKLITASAESVIDSMSSLQEAYDASYAKAMESLEGQMGLFDEMDGKAKTSIDSLIDTLNGQVSYLESYSENIKKAMEMGVDEGLVRKLSDGSEKSAQILDAIVKGGEDDIKALNDALTKVEEGKDTFSDTVAQMETDFNGKMEELVGDYNEAIDKMDLHDESYKIGANNMQGLINGTASQKRTLIAKYTEMGNTALAAYKKAVAQASPSKKFQEAGSYDIQGIIIGATGEKDKLAAVYGEVAKAAVDSVEKALPSDVLTDFLQESKAACEKLLTTIKGERYAVESSAAALKRLLEVENKSAAQKDLISKKVAELNEAVPTLGLAYDSVTDSINLTGEAIERLVEQSGEQKEYEARVERLSELYTEQERISMELEAAREALSQAEAEGSAGVQTLQKSVTELTSAQESNAAQIAELESATAGYNTRQTEMAQKAAEMTRSFRESRTASEELLASMRGEQYVVSTAASSLRSLLAVEEKSAVQKEVIARKAAALNEALPALGLTYDSVTDSINLTGEAIEALVEKSGEQKEYEARVERLSELYAEQTQIFRELETAEDALSEAEAGNAENAGALRDTVAELTEALFDGSTQIIELEAATRAYAQQQAEAAVKAEEMTDRLGKMTEEVQKLHESYESIRKKAYDSISGQLGLFGDLDEETGLSIDSMIASLRSQVEYMNIYSSNIQQAMALGVDKGIIQKLSDGREESSKILAAIVRSGQQEISALNAEFARVEQGKEDFSQTVAEMETDFKNKMGELVTDLNDAMNEMNMADAAYSIGVNNMLGLISGTESQRQALVDAYTDAAKDALTAYKREVGQASPSKKFQDAGSFDIQGIIQGAERQRAALEASYAEAAQAALHSMERHLPSTFREPRTVSREEQIAAAVSAAADREGGVVNHFHIGEMNVRSDADLDYIAQKLYYMQQREVRSRGGGTL